MKIAVRNSDGYVLNGFMIYCEIPHTGRYEDYMALFADEKYTEFEIEELPEFEVRPMMLINFNYLNGNVTVQYTPNKIVINTEIDRLKMELSSSDYKVLKAYECQMTGSLEPYSMSEILAERQALRDKINELEMLLKSI